MRKVFLADQVLSLLFDGLGEPLSANLGIGAIVQDAVFFGRYLPDKIKPIFCPTLELLFRALSLSEKLLPWVERSLVVLSVDVLECLDKLVRAQFAIECKHNGVLLMTSKICIAPRRKARKELFLKET
jgi:hypothetical protein